ncbi:hypothetical protein [Bacteroides sp.]|uniref:hypothetical protein n=1 Tax=Bacteroides sp. TaxID=29523 RepID=UPI003D132CD4
MMKASITLLFIICSLNFYAQENKGIMPNDKDALVYDTVLVFKNIDSIAIYNSTKMFIAQEFKTKECYVDLRGKAIASNGHSYIDTEYQSITINELCTFDFSVYIKNDKCRIVIKDIKVSSSENGLISTDLESYLANLKKIPFTGKKMASKIKSSFNDGVLKLLSRYSDCIANPQNDDMFNF